MKVISFLLCLAWLNVTGCDYVSSKSKAFSKPLAQPTFEKTEKVTIQEARENARPALDEDGLSVNPIQGFNNNAIGSPIGLTTDRLFGTPAANSEDRFSRLENAVQSLSDKFKKMAPAIDRLVGIDQDLDQLTYQLETLINKGAFEESEKEKAKEIAPQASKQTVRKAYKAPSPIQPGSFIQTMRIADHAGKTRIVFETTEKLEFNLSFDNNENLMTISFDRGNLGSDPNKLSKQSKLFQAITQTENGDGTTLAFELTQSTEKVGQGRILPNADNPYHRLFIDLKR